jgi:hypothetical protein
MPGVQINLSRRSTVGFTLAATILPGWRPPGRKATPQRKIGEPQT